MPATSSNNLASQYAQWQSLQLNPPIRVRPGQVIPTNEWVTITSNNINVEPLDLRYNSIESMDDIIQLVERYKKEHVANPQSIVLTVEQYGQLASELPERAEGTIATILGYELILENID